MALSMQQPAQPLAPGQCETCRKELGPTRFALWYDPAKNKRSCEHLFCGQCRSNMMGWNKQLCPNSTCKCRFYDIDDAVDPRTASAEDNMFEYVNHKGTGRITKQELADWYTTNFSMPREDAMQLINSNWHLWDVPKNHPFLKGGLFRSKDQGDLDEDEFPPVHEFLKESFERSLGAMATATAAVVVGNSTTAASFTDPSHDRKRPNTQTDEVVEGIQRKVAQRTAVRSEELQCKLGNNGDRGREWFEHFDRDKNGTLEKRELTTALIETLVGSHQKITQDQITSIVEGIWVYIDTDDSGSVDLEEFQMLRDALMAQLNHDRVNKAVSVMS